jgi:hypothetical protein
MQKITKLYRSSYTGEDQISEMTYSGGDWVKTTQYVPIASQDTTGSGIAVVLGNGISRLNLHPDLFRLLSNHKGGAAVNGALHTYGCNAILRDFVPDFTVANKRVASEIVRSRLCDDNIVYGTAEMISTFPGKFYYIPQNPNWDAGAMAAYLACFDGNTQVYLMGFDLNSGETDYQYNVYADTNGYPAQHSTNTEKYFEDSMLQVMNTYSDVEFVRVMPDKFHYMPESWKYQLNLRQITFKEFVYEVDF